MAYIARGRTKVWKKLVGIGGQAREGPGGLGGGRGAGKGPRGMKKEEWR